MIRFHQVGLQRGRKILFENVEFTLNRGERIGVTGANGCGKSSLFSMLLGDLTADQGEVEMPAAIEIAHVKQETPSVDAAAVDYVIDGDRLLRALEEKISVADEAELGQLYASFEAIDGYTAASRAARLLHGLGFGESQLQEPVKSFSGGWRMRLNLAQALMCRSDLLLLDEPTNHLDMEAVIWLEQWLRHYSGTLLLISHDREFLDRVVNRIAHMEQLNITLYRGNYSAFETQRAERLAQQQAAHEKQLRERAHLHQFVERFRAKATKARQAQSRIKALERMELITAAHVDSEFQFQFLPCGRVGDPLLKLEQADLGHAAGKAVLQNVAMQLRPGSRIGLLGPNGAGKSTLIKSLAGDLPLLCGEKVCGSGLKIGYFAQHQLDQLDLDASALQQFQRQAVDASEQQLRNHLGGFGFHGDRVDEIIRPFSGGEKSRLALAMLIWQQPNLLLLDEPTNHLDLEMRHALTLALQGYEGALLIVSHDRHMLRSCTDELYLIHAGNCDVFNGDLDDYRKYIAEQENEEKAATVSQREKADRKAQRREAAELRKQLQPLTNKLKKVEAEMEKLQQTESEQAQLLADESLYQQDMKSRLREVLEEKAATSKRISQLEESWLKLSEQIEAIVDN